MRLKPLNILRKENPVSYLTRTFFNEYKQAIHHLNPSEQLELTEHFIEMMDSLSGFASNIGNKNGGTFTDDYLASFDKLLLKYGNKFKPYVDCNFIQYFFLPLVLVTKGYYEKDEIDREENEPLKVEEALSFAFICKSQLNSNRIDLITSDAHLYPNENLATKNVGNDLFDEPEEQIEKKVDSQLLSIVSEHLAPFRDSFNKDADYKDVVNAIAQFLGLSQAYTGKVIFVKGGIIKKLAFALGEIWRSTSNEIISAEYLMLYTQLFSIFSRVEIDKSNIFSNNLYKYSISKT